VETRVYSYENSPDEDLFIDRYPEADNCWIVGGGSGHRFKLGPAKGEMVARRIIDGGELEPKLRVSRLTEIKGASTQFD
jgi:glycine/D-amino acid oxidase-like deaminating enzyme